MIEDVVRKQVTAMSGRRSHNTYHTGNIPVE